mgnify:CR=1 FL=1
MEKATEVSKKHRYSRRANNQESSVDDDKDEINFSDYLIKHPERKGNTSPAKPHNHLSNLKQE